MQITVTNNRSLQVQPAFGVPGHDLATLAVQNYGFLIKHSGPRTYTAREFADIIEARYGMLEPRNEACVDALRSIQTAVDARRKSLAQLRAQAEQDNRVVACG
jgi:hypothetical protein